MRLSLALGGGGLFLFASTIAGGCGDSFRAGSGHSGEAGEGGEAGDPSGGFAGASAGAGGEAGESTGGSSGGSDPGGGGSQGGSGRGGGAGEGGQAGMETGGAGGTGGSDAGSGSGAVGGVGARAGSGGATAGFAGGGGGGEAGAPVIPSCTGMSGNECQGGSCCESPLVPGGTFDQGEPDAFRSTVSSFRLDRYEVVVGRFRRFAAAYESWRIAGNPLSGSGAHPEIPDSGWRAGWTSLLPASAAALRGIVQCNDDYATWEDEPGNETLPMNCVSWYEAFAFCIWDGGRLPTEAEWEYAAVGGSDDTMYPWGNTPVPDNLDGSRAVYNCLGDGMTGCSSADVLSVGSRPLGQGRYLHGDLAGSLFEWVLDHFGPLPTLPQSSYANIDADGNRVARGGNWGSLGSDIGAASRHGRDPGDRYYGIYGFRCARAP